MALWRASSPRSRTRGVRSRIASSRTPRGLADDGQQGRDHGERAGVGVSGNLVSGVARLYIIPALIWQGVVLAAVLWLVVALAPYEP